jgi:protocatechuate 3,4-dioxygenase beta subunit
MMRPGRILLGATLLAGAVLAAALVSGRPPRPPENPPAAEAPKGVDIKVTALDLDSAPRRQPIALPEPFVAGRVADSQGKPVADATVHATWLDPSWPPKGRDARSRETKTAQDGSFRLTGIEEVPVNLTIHHPEFATPWVEMVAPGSPEVEVALYRRARLEGVVEDGETRLPIAPSDIELHREIDSGRRLHSPWHHRRGRDDRPAAFEFDGLNPGSYALEVSARGYTKKRVEGIVIREGEIRTDLVVLLFRPAKIRGRVVDAASGMPVANAKVGPMDPDGSSFRSHTLSGGSGSFELVDVEPGTVRLRAESRRAILEESVPIHLRPGETIEGIVLRVAPRGAVLGFAIGRNGSRFVRGQAYLRREGIPGLRSATFDPEGTFLFEGIDPGEYEVEAVVLDAKPGGLAQGTLRTRVVVEKGRTAEVVLSPQ